MFFNSPLLQDKKAPKSDVTYQGHITSVAEECSSGIAFISILFLPSASPVLK